MNIVIAHHHLPNRQIHLDQSLLIKDQTKSRLNSLVLPLLEAKLLRLFLLVALEIMDNPAMQGLSDIFSFI